MSKINLANGAAPSTPPLGTTEIFVDTDKHLKQIDDAGNIVDLTTVGSGITQLTGDVIAGPGTGSQAATVANNAVSNTKLADVATGTLKGRATAGTGDPEDLSGTQATSLLDIFTSLLKGLVPPSGGGTANFLRADGSWAAPAAAGGFDPTTTSEAFDDFLNNADPDELGELGWAVSQTGTGTPPETIPGEANHPGIISLGPGATGTTRSCIHLGLNGIAPIRSLGGIVFQTAVRLGAVSGYSRFVAGLGDIVNAIGDQTNGIYFSFDIAAGNTTWHLVAASGGVRTRIDTGISVSASTWYRLKFTINSAGTSIQANINGVDVGAALTTNIPSVALNWLYKGDGVASGSNTDLDIDFFHYKQTGLTR